MRPPSRRQPGAMVAASGREADTREGGKLVARWVGDPAHLHGRVERHTVHRLDPQVGVHLLPQSSLRSVVRLADGGIGRGRCGVALLHLAS